MSPVSLMSSLYLNQLGVWQPWCFCEKCRLLSDLHYFIEFTFLWDILEEIESSTSFILIL